MMNSSEKKAYAKAAINQLELACTYLTMAIMVFEHIGDGGRAGAVEDTKAELEKTIDEVKKLTSESHG